MNDKLKKFLTEALQEFIILLVVVVTIGVILYGMNYVNGLGNTTVTPNGVENVTRNLRGLS